MFVKWDRGIPRQMSLKFGHKFEDVYGEVAQKCKEPIETDQPNYMFMRHV